jgi:hypothetical protein
MGRTESIEIAVKKSVLLVLRQEEDLPDAAFLP